MDLTEAAVADPATRPVRQADLAQYAALLIENCEGKPIADPPATVLAGQPDGSLMVIARAGPATGTGISAGMPNGRFPSSREDRPEPVAARGGLARDVG